jgi:[CysO sulfur-carrier protein]-thiocarboxylate-dependent cysteine synthase
MAGGHVPLERRSPAASSVLELIGGTPLVELARTSPNPNVKIYAKLEGQNPTGSIKDRVAKTMIDTAEAKGELVPGRELLEPTSGNTGISLAMVAKVKGYGLTCVMPENSTSERVRLLELFGAKVVLSPAEEGSNGAVRLGTGGTLMGAGDRLRESFPEVQIIAAEPLQGDPVMGLRSLEDGYVPPILDVTKLDRKILVSNREAVLGLRALLGQEGIFGGVSSGAVLHVARQVARELEEGTVVTVLADGGWKYLSADFWTEPLDDIERSMEDKAWW